MAIIRWILGRIILLLDFLTRPRGIKRTPEQQAVLDTQTSRLSLYQYAACPFCVKVRRAMRRQSLKIETRDAKKQANYRQELLQQGGQLKVPCLRIESENGDVQWMYESSDIVRYLDSVAAV
uniref:glutathione S-transferase N-terminal domain-containing protein n=1 Tax=Marinobacterium profundum TaxID=1714300 RepID=UPI000836DB7F|nr:glutathione S-transferase N-terminal domain-containing protein [Marinobacterium profundum]